MLPKPRAFWISLCNLVGLGLSLSGVVLLFFYALPPVVPGAPQAITAEGGSQDATRSYVRDAHIGLAFVIAGTVMEAVPPLAMFLLVARRGSGPTLKLSPSQAADVALFSTDHLRVVYKEAGTGDPARLGASNLTRSQLEGIIRYRVWKEERRFYVTTIAAVAAAVFAFAAWLFPTGH